MKMQATLKANLVSYRKVEFDTEVQEEIIRWGNGRITKGPDGGVRLHGARPKSVYVPTGDYIIHNGGGHFSSMKAKMFEELFHTF